MPDSESYLKREWRIRSIAFYSEKMMLIAVRDVIVRLVTATSISHIFCNGFKTENKFFLKIVVLRQNNVIKWIEKLSLTIYI